MILLDRLKVGHNTQSNGFHMLHRSTVTLLSSDYWTHNVGYYVVHVHVPEVLSYVRSDYWCCH